jgi:hypothetical protein
MDDVRHGGKNGARPRSPPRTHFFLRLAIALETNKQLGFSEKQGNQDASEDEQRRNRVLFWAVLILDHTVSLGTGRMTTFRVEQIKVDVPHEDDVPDRSPFRHAASLMRLYGPLINLLNGERDDVELPQKLAKVNRALILAYQSLPSDMVWHVTK